MEQARTYQTIKARLVSMIGSTWSAGSRLPPIKTLAAELGAGQTNTYRAIRELVAQGVLSSSVRHGTFVLKTAPPLDAAIAHAGQKQQDVPPVSAPSIAVVILATRSVWTSYLRTVMDAAQQALPRAGSEVVLQKVSAPTMQSRHWQDDHLAGYLLLNSWELQPLSFPTHKPVVCFSTSATLCVCRTEGYDVISPDSHQGGYLLGSHLKNLGCSSVCFVGRNVDRHRLDATSHQRLAGFEMGLGRNVEEKHRIFIRQYNPADGAMAVSKYLEMDPRPQAVFCASDDLAIGFAHGAGVHGLQPGRDFHLVGFDGQERSRHLPQGPLTTAAIPTELAGQSAARFLLTRIAQPHIPVRHLQLGCTLIQGSTTGSLAAAPQLRNHRQSARASKTPARKAIPAGV